VRRNALALAASLVSGCCLGDFASIPDPDENPPPGDERPIAMAREHARAEVPRLLAVLDAGAGPACEVAASAIDAAPATVVHGQLGGAIAQQVRLALGGCVDSAWISVVWSDHAWRAVAIGLLDVAGTVIARSGTFAFEEAPAPPAEP